jgi:predicted phosphate transport protein (TIGR00153 family)
MAAKVQECTDLVPDLFEACYADDQDALLALAKQISHKEHEADVTKTRVRDAMPSSLLLPVDRRDALDVLSSLDAVADCVEDVAILFTIRRMEPHEKLEEPLRLLVGRVMATVDKSLSIVKQLEDVSRASFSGREAERIRAMLDELGRLEHEADKAQDMLAKVLFSIEDEIKPVSVMMWGKIFNKVGDIANHAERTGNRLRLFFAD